MHAGLRLPPSRGRADHGRPAHTVVSCCAQATHLSAAPAAASLASAGRSSARSRLRMNSGASSRRERTSGSRDSHFSPVTRYCDQEGEATIQGLGRERNREREAKAWAAHTQQRPPSPLLNPHPRPAPTSMITSVSTPETLLALHSPLSLLATKRLRSDMAPGRRHRRERRGGGAAGSGRRKPRGAKPLQLHRSARPVIGWSQAATAALESFGWVSFPAALACWNKSVERVSRGPGSEAMMRSAGGSGSEPPVPALPHPSLLHRACWATHQITGRPKQG